MSETVIFLVGIAVFAITVYGSVIAGGIALTRVEIEQDPALKGEVKKEQLDKRLPKLKY